MKFVLFCHSFLSCWNHGNAHFLRGVARELLRLGHEVTVHEPVSGWSRAHMLAEQHGPRAFIEASHLVPGVEVESYAGIAPDLDAALQDADVVIVHEWNPPALIEAIGRKRIAGGHFLLLFHDTHHRAATARGEIEALNFAGYDGVLAFGEALRELYLDAGWGRRVFTWHEAADIALFKPLRHSSDADLVWIGNWGDGERTQELDEFLIAPCCRLGLKTQIYGVRYPDEIVQRLADRSIQYRGWLPNHHVPEVFARARVTVHVPRRAYVEALPGIPTIRMFEALACGIPLVSAPWSDCENLFPAGSYLPARNGEEMCAALSLLMRDRALAVEMARFGVEVIRSRHSCAHRVSELLAIVRELGRETTGPAAPAFAYEPQALAS